MTAPRQNVSKKFRIAAAARSAIVFENMEARQMMTAVTVTGTNAADTILVTQNGASITVQLNGQTKTYANQATNTLRIDGLGGNDNVSLAGSAGTVSSPATIYGGDGNDSIYAGNGNDYIDGGAGNDNIRGVSGNDSIYGQDGNDTILSGAGNDMVYGGHGDDSLDGEAGTDYVNGNGQTDTVLNTAVLNATASRQLSASFAATARSSAAVKILSLWTDNDIARGGEGNDVVDGAGGNDAVYGGIGDDEVWGGDGNDRVYGGAGNDRLIGGSGDDVLVSLGGGVKDLSWGQAGNDSFWLDDARTTELAMDGEPAEFAGSNFHFVSAFQTLTVKTTSSTTNDHRAESKELDGQNFIDPATTAAYKSFSNMPLFAADGASRDDIRQGAAGDCYFMAGLSAVAKTNANTIRQAVVDLGDGTYGVRFFQNGLSKFFRVDADLPASGSTPTYAKLGHANSSWVAIMEKAFAFFRAGVGTYASIDTGYLREPFNALGLTNGNTSKTGATQWLQTIKSSLDQGKALTALTPAAAPTNGAPAISGHVYSVESVDLTAGTITLRNPWGYDGAGSDANTNDGYVTLTADQFFGYFIEAHWSNVA